MSEPAGAVCRVDKWAVQAPGTVLLRRDTDYVAVCELPGHLPERVDLESSLQGDALLGSFVLGAIVGGITDLATGAAFELSPEVVKVRLRPAPETAR